MDNQDYYTFKGILSRYMKHIPESLLEELEESKIDAINLKIHSISNFIRPKYSDVLDKDGAELAEKIRHHFLIKPRSQRYSNN